MKNHKFSYPLVEGVPGLEINVNFSVNETEIDNHTPDGCTSVPGLEFCGIESVIISRDGFDTDITIDFLTCVGARPSIEAILAMSPDDRLKMLKTIYPHRCIYKCPYQGAEYTCDHNVHNFGKLFKDGSIDAGNGKGFLFYEGKWAEIVSLPYSDTNNTPSKWLKQFYNILLEFAADELSKP